MYEEDRGGQGGDCHGRQCFAGAQRKVGFPQIEIKIVFLTQCAGPGLTVSISEFRLRNYNISDT